MSADLDREIDRAVRSLLDAEPSPRLRWRVLASLERPKGPVLSAASLVPIAVVAIVLVLALVLRPWRSAPPPMTTTADAHDMRLPTAGVERAPDAPHPSATIAQPAPRRSRALTARAAPRATAAEPEDPGIAALVRPAPLSVETIAAPEVTVMPSIQPAPLGVAALDLRALEMPPDAARGADR